MITNLRRINSRYRGPIESQKLSLFYQGVELNLSDLKERFKEQEEKLKKSKKLLLNRDVDKTTYITRVDYKNSFYGISIMYPIEEALNQVHFDYVGILRDTLKLEPEIMYQPNTKAFPIQQIATLDRIFTSFDEFKITPGMAPIESLVYANLDRTYSEQEVNHRESN